MPGLWFSAGELYALLETAGQPLDTPRVSACDKMHNTHAIAIDHACLWEAVLQARQQAAE